MGILTYSRLTFTQETSQITFWSKSIQMSVLLSNYTRDCWTRTYSCSKTLKDKLDIFEFPWLPYIETMFGDQMPKYTDPSVIRKTEIMSPLNISKLRINVTLKPKCENMCSGRVTYSAVVTHPSCSQDKLDTSILHGHNCWKYVQRSEMKTDNENIFRKKQFCSYKTFFIHCDHLTNE